MADNDERFKTHIKEPRWQQVVSVIIVICLLALWLWFTFR
jgi:cytoskeletal protein RodZ